MVAFGGVRGSQECVGEQGRGGNVAGGSLWVFAWHRRFRGRWVEGLPVQPDRRLDTRMATA